MVKVASSLLSSEKKIDFEPINKIKYSIVKTHNLIIEDCWNLLLVPEKKFNYVVIFISFLFSISVFYSSIEYLINFNIKIMIKKINVYKMHCSACELLMDSTLNEIPWVKVLKVSHKNNLLEIEIKNEQVLDKVYKEIKKLWYSLENNISTKNTFLDYVIIVLFL